MFCSITCRLLALGFLSEEWLNGYGARPCSVPPLAQSHFIAGDKDYFLILQNRNRVTINANAH